MALLRGHRVAWTLRVEPGVALTCPAGATGLLPGLMRLVLPPGDAPGAPLLGLGRAPGGPLRLLGRKPALEVAS